MGLMRVSRTLHTIAATALLPAIAVAQLATVLIATESSQRIQNQRADAENLSRMQNVTMLNRFRDHGYLVHVPASTPFYYLRSIPAKYRYLRPWSRLFLDRLSEQFHARFNARLKVTSLVRTVAFQVSLQKRNSNAAAATGPLSSSHLTGATLDISKTPMSTSQMNWMRRVLSNLRKAGYLYAVEEFQQPAFHVMVYRNYVEYVKSRQPASNLGGG